MPEPGNTIPSTTPDHAKLARHMTLFSLVVYGVGDMIGTGIYVTVGKAAGYMGNAVWLAFIASMVVALLTGLSYASISSRYPRAAGAAYVTQRAFGWTFLSYFVGLAVTASGLTSMATSSNAFAKTLNEDFVGFVPIWMLLIAFLVALTLLNLWGIRESMWGNLVCTSVEVGGVLLIIVLGARFWGSVNYLHTPADVVGADGVRQSGLALSMVMTGAVLTFFSFVGFEDMLNVAEEVKNPARTMPMGIIIALVITTLLYIGVSITAVSAVSAAQLKDVGAPFKVVAQKVAPFLPEKTYSLITLFAVANTALINFIMGSRLVYGMSRQGLVPSLLSRVHPSRRTPHVAILTLAVLVVLLALAGRVQLGDARIDPVAELAQATALLLLGCFCIVNISLVLLKLRPTEPKGRFEIPIFIPALGALACLALIFTRIVPLDGARIQWRAPAIAAAVGIGIVVLYLIMRPKQMPDRDTAGELDG